MAEVQRSSGTVKWFSAQKGFGFIAPEDGGEDLFVHQTSIKSEGFRTLSEGQTVEFSVDVGEDGRTKAAEEPSHSFLVGLEFTSSLSMFSNHLTGERRTLGWLRLLVLSFLALACEMYLLVRFVVARHPSLTVIANIEAGIYCVKGIPNPKQTTKFIIVLLCLYFQDIASSGSQCRLRTIECNPPKNRPKDYNRNIKKIRSNYSKHVYQDAAFWHYRMMMIIGREVE
ncbi:hypothetical protein CUMW_061740 [Citrus unshiu]|uniref:CSD domain-containing protein n=1 Tax=Citrus unshiu TaxID=55188 RepID=A0A2H5NNJ2_CITUN|nr:hypothetical protein CUMW_061740 [Citrus unshiu]